MTRSGRGPVPHQACPSIWWAVALLTGRDSQDTFCCKSGRGDRASPVGDDRQFLCTASPRSDNRVHLFAGSAQVYSLCGVLHVRVGLSLLREPGSIRRPSPYEGDVLPTELPRIVRMVVLAS